MLRGALAGIGAAEVVQAARLVHTGEVISLVRALDSPNPPAGRPALRRWSRQHNVLRDLGSGKYAVLNDDVVEFALQGSSHWDSLGHFGAIDDTPGVFHGGGGLEEIGPDATAGRLGIDAFAPGIVARGVLIDAVGPGRDRMDNAELVTATIVLERLAETGITLRQGDVVCVYTGAELSLDEATAMPAATPGLAADTVPIWREARIAGLVCDNIAVDPIPVGAYPIHRGVLRGLGVPLGEMWRLRQLAQSCRVDGVYEFLLVSVPLNIPGAFGSPANAVAIR